MGVGGVDGGGGGGKGEDEGGVWWAIVGAGGEACVWLVGWVGFLLDGVGRRVWMDGWILSSLLDIPKEHTHTRMHAYI